MEGFSVLSRLWFKNDTDLTTIISDSISVAWNKILFWQSKCPFTEYSAWPPKRFLADWHSLKNGSHTTQKIYNAVIEKGFLLLKPSSSFFHLFVSIFFFLLIEVLILIGFWWQILWRLQGWRHVFLFIIKALCGHFSLWMWWGAR